MPDKPSPLADQALARLRKLADGNGLPPARIQLVGADEAVYEIGGLMRLTPAAEVQGGHYPGPPRGDGKQVLGSVSELRAELQRRREAFQSRADWIPLAIERLKEQPGQGWGLDDVRIDMPAPPAFWPRATIVPPARATACSTARNAKARGRWCARIARVSGTNIAPLARAAAPIPSSPISAAAPATARVSLPAASAVARVRLPCPTCHGQRGTACATCNGTGVITEEATLSCAVRTHFSLKADGLPSGLRRGLDRLGIAALANGHADIEAVKPPPTEEEIAQETMSPSPDDYAPPPEEKEKPPQPEVHYKARLPYADMRMDFAGKKALVAVFGKKGLLMGVPAFLDDALAPWREQLRAAVAGGPLEPALEARAIRDALALQLDGKDQPADLRRLYPLGLTPTVAGEILADMRRALDRFTRQQRASVAAVAIMLAGILFGGLFLTPLYGRLAAGLALPFEAVADGVLLAIVLGFGWLALTLSTRLTLQRRFPELTIARMPKTGAPASVMFGGIILLYLAMIWIAPAKPAWLIALLGTYY